MAEKGAFSIEDLISTANRQHIPELVESPPVTSKKAIDEALNVLREHKDNWVALDIPERITILEEISNNAIKVADRWVALSLKAKGLLANPVGEAEEWVLVAMVVRAVQLVRQSLIDIQKRGRPHIAGKITTRMDGQVVAHVFPRNRIESLLFRGVAGEVWMEPGVTAEETVKTQAFAYRDKNHKGKVALVLGAGNISALPLMDLLHKLFVEDQVVILKLNPVNAYLGPLIEDSFAALIERGFLRIIYGGVEQSSFACYHEAVDEIHLTGSDKTFEAITFGSGAEGERRKAERKPLITKRSTSELGNISPVIIVPGPWDEDDIQEQARHLATWLVVNAGFGCLTPRVIIQHKAWAKRHALVDAIGHVLDRVETRKAYYPGARERHTAFVAAHPDARQFGDATGDRLPWTLIAGVDPDDQDDICFQRESFCSLFAETALEAPTVADYVLRAVEFANNTLWGTLTATLIVHPDSLADQHVAAAVDRALAELRYGTVLVNLFAVYSVYFMVAPWGGFPGQSIYDIQSGIGKTSNMLMFKRPQKSVVWAPFRKPLDPLTVTSKRPHHFARKLAHLEASPVFWRLPGVLWSALRS